MNGGGTIKSDCVKKVLDLQLDDGEAVVRDLLAITNNMTEKSQMAKKV